VTGSGVGSTEIVDPAHCKKVPEQRALIKSKTDKSLFPQCPLLSRT
jgi:hypothetical protein